MPSTKPPRSRPQPKAGRASPPARRPPVILIAVGLVALLGVVAIVATRGGSDDATTDGLEQTRPVQVTGEPLALLVDGIDQARGAPAPELAGARFDGDPLRIGADARPKVLVFLAHWCPHCQREVPVLSDWLAANGTPDDVDLYGIATGTSPDRPNYPPSAWLEREGFMVPTLADDAQGSAAQAFGLSAFPYFVALDADNKVIARASGELSIEQWEALLNTARRTR